MYSQLSSEVKDELWEIGRRLRASAQLEAAVSQEELSLTLQRASAALASKFRRLLEYLHILKRDWASELASLSYIQPFEYSAREFDHIPPDASRAVVKTSVRRCGSFNVFNRLRQTIPGELERLVQSARDAMDAMSRSADQAKAKERFNQALQANTELDCYKYTASHFIAAAEVAMKNKPLDLHR